MKKKIDLESYKKKPVVLLNHDQNSKPIGKFSSQKEESMIVMKFTEKENEVIQEFKERFGESFSGSDKALAQFIIAKMSATKDNVLEFIYELMGLLQKQANDQANGGIEKSASRLMGHAFDALRSAISDNLKTPLRIYAEIPEGEAEKL